MRYLFVPKGGITEENFEEVKRRIDAANAILEKSDEHACALGHLATAWAGLDARLNGLFVPLLNCSEAQVACILVENISTRCEMLKKLLHAEPLPEKWVQWVEGLLTRAIGELASMRNRYIHDGWKTASSIAVRVRLNSP